jgi:hypothetical protein
MKVAILSESPADEAAVRILVEAVLAEKVEAIRPPTVRPGGITGVLRILGPVPKWLHYRR